MCRTKAWGDVDGVAQHGSVASSMLLPVDVTQHSQRGVRGVVGLILELNVLPNSG